MNGYDHKTRSCDSSEFCLGIIINGRCPKCGKSDTPPQTNGHHGTEAK
jgi:uncharacterized OB-fold protein